MQKLSSYNLTSSLIRAFAFGIGVVVCIWFLYTVISAVLLFLLAIVSAIIINAPVTWLERKKLPRSLATLLVFLMILLFIALFCWLIVPMVSIQLKSLVANVPVYVDKIEKMLSAWRADYFPWVAKVAHQNEQAVNIGSVTNTLWKLGGFSISLLESFLLFLVLVSLTAYMVINPRPLLVFYLSLFPYPQREKAENVFVKTSIMIIGWMRANLIGGAIEGVSVIIFLNILKVPGAWVWGVLTLFSIMIPRVGFYIMSIPPTLVALSISPLTALWVFVFFLVVDEISGDFIMPKLRSSATNIHPVSIIFFLLVMGSAFGFMGILLSTPIAAFLKAVYEEFYLSRLKADENLDQRIEAMIKRKKA